MYFFAFRFQCNLTKDQEVTSALRGADCVYHLASYGMSGKEHVIRTLITCLACFLDGHLKKKIGRKIGLLFYKIPCNFILNKTILFSGDFPVTTFLCIVAKSIFFVISISAV